LQDPLRGVFIPNDSKMVPWDVCIMPKYEGGLGLIDVASQGSILEAKWVIQCSKGSPP
jgi:hypothetical protein